MAKGSMARGRQARRKPQKHACPFPPTGSGFAQRVDGSEVRAIFRLASDKEDKERCVACHLVHENKFDTSLMCSLGHTTCFGCVARDIQPHPICSAHCNGFKFKCADCGTWSCVSKTQELAMLCGHHSVAHDRLRKQRISHADFEKPRICTCRDVDSDDPDTPSSASSADEDAAEAAQAEEEHRVAWTNDEAVMQLPRVCHVDFGFGHAQREQRLARLRRSLLGCNRVVGR